ncbi:MAG: hypothetical protein R3E31_01175 [Chloroflexota bacterium]
MAKEPTERPPSAAAALALLTPQAERPIVLRAGSQELLPELIAYTAAEETAVAIEQERRRIAQLLHSQVSDALHMLLAQAGNLRANPGGEPGGTHGCVRAHRIAHARFCSKLAI